MDSFKPERRAPGEYGNMDGVTQDEVSKLTKAMKNDEFRAHIEEYTREISDPANKQEYLDYLAQIEAKGEMPEGQQLLRCQPGLCVKTHISFKNGQKQKCFINIVQSDQLDDMSFQTATKGNGQQVYLPYSLSPPRPDRDHKDEYCMTTDFAVSTGSFMRASQNSQIMKMMIDTAADGMASQFLKGHEEVSKDYKVMQRMNCKGGQPMPMSVRAELLKDKGKKSQAPKIKPGQDAVTPAELKEMRKNAKQKKKLGGVPEPEEEDEEPVKKKAEEPTPGRIRVPQHRLVHSGTLDLTDYMEVNGRQDSNTIFELPRLLKLIVELPSVKKSSDINMEVTCDNVVVEVEGKYYLDLPLPYEIKDADGNAKFDKAKQTLTLELPVVPKLPDPEAIAAAKRYQGLGSFVTEDGALSEGGDDDELPPIEDAEAQAESKEEVAGKAEEVAGKAEEVTGKAEEVAEKVEQKKRELLEFNPEGSSLRLASTTQEEVVEKEAAVEEVVEIDSDMPSFVAASSFEGARAGYYFGTGEEGLGYYRDLRQRARQPAKPRPPSAPSSPSGPAEPFVTEVEERQLPKYAETYREVTASLSTRLSASEVDVATEENLAVHAHLGRQNVVLRIGVPSSDREVADLRLSLVGRRLTLSLCCRPSSSGGSASSSGSRWRRHCVRRTLCGAIDLRQWHAELVSAPGASSSASTSGLEVQVVLRKLTRDEVWASALVGAPSSGTASSGTAALVESSEPREASEAIALGLAQEPEAPKEVQADTSAAVEDVAAVEDSAELDAADPVVHDTSKVEGPTAPTRSTVLPNATASVVQSATVMGQSVLLRNKLMFQLL
mmetsp:Transcript_81404/g.143713  ORF Transcript_81404/g.143713 Transcript_81404/m.143713 type:complete len:832 (+) Transcript_81404:76-2571(+)